MDAPRESSLKRLQAGYSQLFERYPLPMLVVDLATLRLLAANDAAAKCYGYSIAQLTQMHLPDIYFDEDHPSLPAFMALGPQERAKQRRWRHKGQGGRAIEVEIDTDDMQLHGLPTRMLLVSDVTPDVAAAPLASSLPQQSLEPVQTLADGFFMLDQAARFTAVNPHAEELLHVRCDQLMGRTLWECCPLGVEAAYRQQYETVAVQRQAICFEFYLAPRKLWLEVRAFACSDGVAVYFRDVSTQHEISRQQAQERERLNAIVHARDLADAERQAARVQLSDLARRLMSQEKDLVKRVAQALHDQLGQTTAAIRIIHDTMGVLRRGKESREYLRLDLQLGKLIDQATRQVRMVLVDLHPPLLDEYGLAAALDNELRSRALSQKSINFVLNVPPAVLDVRWPSAVEYGAFMIGREAIENAIRHSHATMVTVTLGGALGSMELEVSDNGYGIAPKSPAKAGHLGITGMLERAQSIGGAVTVYPAASGGTRVHLRWSEAP